MLILVFNSTAAAEAASDDLNERFINHDLVDQTISIDPESTDSPMLIKPYDGLTAIII